MCGIAGIVSKDGSGIQRDIDRMTDTVSHRGPDGRGTFIFDNVALGHRRLSIFDLSSRGSQPMHWQNRFAITFNGAIYNFLEIRAELEQLGESFVSATDTEVILAAYAHWGIGCVERFNGMWSFAILDRQERKVVLCRDRFGIKPLFYASNDKGFYFASEVKQLLCVGISAAPNFVPIGDFLIHRTADYGTNSFFSGIERVEPGTWLQLDIDTGATQTKQYYSLPGETERACHSTGDSIEQYLALIEDSVRLRMRADVKVGTCLSGGLDSSTIAVLAADILRSFGDESARLSAITAVSEDLDVDESAFAKMVADAGRMDWYPVKPSSTEFEDTIDDIFESQDEPFTSPSLTMQYFVMKAARSKGVKVLLDGQGGDETLLGYTRHRIVVLRELTKRFGWRHAATEFRAMQRNDPAFGGLAALKFFRLRKITNDTSAG